MASQGESCDEWESEACQQGGAGTLRSMAGAWEKAGVEIRSRRGLSFALLFPYSLFLIPWGGEAPERAPLSLGNGGFPYARGLRRDFSSRGVVLPGARWRQG